jgi:hypothetical protein
MTAYIATSQFLVRSTWFRKGSGGKAMEEVSTLVVVKENGRNKFFVSEFRNYAVGSVNFKGSSL